jgi:hypothetical protein
MAFGDRVVHMDLVFDRPIIEDRLQSHLDEECLDAETCLCTDEDGSQRWMWRGCICRRNGPGAPIEPEDWTEP